MNRDETTKLLELLCGAYPNVKIKDPQSMVTSWELTLGSYSAESVYKAARLHMTSSPFFPTPADIREKIVRARIVYDSPISKRLEAVNRQSEQKKWEPFINAFCQKMGFDGEPNEEIDLRDYLPFGERMPNFLDYEQ